jgi:hypothetical protein
MTGDPWLEAMLDDIHEQLDVLIETRGHRKFSHEEKERYWALVRELAEIEHALKRSR